MRLSDIRHWVKRIRRYQTAFGGELARTNVQRMMLLGTFVIPVSLLHLLVFWQFTPTSANETSWRLGIIGFHASLAIIVATLLVAIRFSTPGQVRDRILSAIGLAVALGSGIVVTLIDQQVTPATTPFIISCMLTGTVFLMPPLHALLAYSGTLVIYLLALGGWQLDSVLLLSSRMDGLTAVALGFALSVILWSQVVHTRRQRRIIQTQQRNLQEANSRLTTLAAIDELTGLGNRRILTLLLEQELAAIRRSGNPACLLILDIDHFKAINDQHGHVEGDSALQQFAQLLKSCVRASDHVSRWGGEEFAILLRNTTLDMAKNVAESLRQRIKNHTFLVNDQPTYLTVSIGITDLIPYERDALMQAYQRADQMLYKAKTAGRNQIRAAT